MKPQLAGKYDPAKIVKHLPLDGQLKFDGIRVFFRGGIAFTRSLKPVPAQEVQTFASMNRHQLEGLDTEITCGPPESPDCYRRTMKFVMSGNAPDDDWVCNVFDMWDQPTTFAERYAEASIVVDTMKHERLKMVVNTPLYTIEDIVAFHDEMIQRGHEGIILRKPDSFYKFGRATASQGQCIKMKEGGWVDTEVRIVSFNEEFANENEQTTNELGRSKRSSHKENKIPKDTLGSLVVRGKFEDGTDFECKVGTGFDHELRQTIWYNQDEYKTKIVKMKYFKVGVKDKPRFPTFLGFRDPLDMDAEQLSFL